ncbi:MAG TPA: AI-2E family transporter [Anaerolineae bacterium]
MSESTPPQPAVRPPQESPPWSRTTKIIVAIVALLLVVWMASRFETLIAQLVVAAMLAYILNPIIILLDRRTGLSRGMAILVVYLLLLIAFIGAFIALGVAAFDQVTTLLTQVPDLIDDVTSYIEALTSRTEPIFIGPIEIAPTTIDWDAVANQLLGLVEPVVSQGGQFIRGLATATVRWLGYLLLVFVLSIYFASEIPQLGNYVARVAHQPGYRTDAERLMREFGRIWGAYLRGQVILGLVIFFVVWIGLSALGVQNALALGLLSGLLEFIPVIGPVIGAAAAVIVAFFQPENYLGLPSWQFALAVLALMIVIQQLENNVLVPRIVGEALDLHPLVVMVGVFMGGSLAGVLGAILAAPVVATLKLLSLYAWRKMFDLPPFPSAEPEPRPPSPTWSERWQRLVARFNQQQDTS